MQKKQETPFLSINQKQPYPIRIHIHIFFDHYCKLQTMIAKSFTPFNYSKLSITEATSAHSLRAAKAVKLGNSLAYEARMAV